MAVSDTQQEEYSTFVSLAEDLDTALNNAARSPSDQLAKVVFATKNISLSALLSGERKVGLVDRRKVAFDMQEHVAKNIESLY